MKIIGSTGGGYLVDATEHELDLIAGFDVRQRLSRGGWRGPVGFQLDVSKAWSRIRDIDLRKDELAKAAGAMRALADLLTDKLDVVTMPPEVKEEPNG